MGLSELVQLGSVLRVGEGGVAHQQGPVPQGHQEPEHQAVSSVSPGQPSPAGGGLQVGQEAQDGLYVVAESVESSLVQHGLGGHLHSDAVAQRPRQVRPLHLVRPGLQFTTTRRSVRLQQHRLLYKAQQV